MTNPRKFFIRIVCAIYALLLLVAALVYTVDPSVRYRAPGFFKLQFSAKNALHMIPGVLRHMPHDSVIIGDSMMLNTDLADVRELLGWEAVKATAGGSWPAAHSRFLDIAFERDPPPRNILFGLTLHSYAHGADRVQFPLPEHLFEPRPWREPSYLWNFDVLTGPLYRSLQTTFGGGSTKHRRRTDLDIMFASNTVENENRQYGEDVFRRWHTGNPPMSSPPVVTTVEGMMAGLETNLLRHIRAHRGTRFELALSSFSQVHWHGAQKREHWPVLLDFNRAALAELISQPNVRVHDLQTVREIVCNLENYKDTVHHKPSINRWIIERVAAADRVMTTNDIPAFIEAITRLGDATNQPPWALAR